MQSSGIEGSSAAAGCLQLGCSGQCLCEGLGTMNDTEHTVAAHTIKNHAITVEDDKKFALEELMTSIIIKVKVFLNLCVFFCGA